MARRDYDDYDDRDSRRYDEEDDRYDDNYGDSYDDDSYDDRSYDDDGYEDDPDDYDHSRYDDDERDEFFEEEDDGYGNEPRGQNRNDRRGPRRRSGYEDGYEDIDTFEDEYGEREERIRRRENDLYRGGNSGGNGSGKSHRGRRIVLIVIEVAALAAILLILYFVNQLSRVEKVNLPTQEIESNIADEVKQSEETGEMKGYRNVAFFGVDSTTGELTQNTRSDSIMICSINQDTGDVKLVSVYRDTLLNIGDDTYNKCNAAYSKGGAEQAINMLNSNLDMNITDFVTVGFGGLTDVINDLGGITIDVQEDEIQHLNNYQLTMSKELGMDYTEVTSPGPQTLDGLQATAYCRIRYTRGWDYKRAARQRAVLYAIVDKAKQADIATLTKAVSDVTDEIYTSYSADDILKDVQAISSYNMVEEDSIDSMSNGLPQENYRIQAELGGGLGDCVVPRTLADNVRWLHQFLFEDESYQVSDTVQAYSDHIDEMTQDAVDEPMTDADHT